MAWACHCWKTDVSLVLVAMAVAVHLTFVLAGRARNRG